MTHDEFQNEKTYQVIMSLSRKALHEGVITEEEYRKLEAAFEEKYKPLFGSLFSDIRLT